MAPVLLYDAPTSSPLGSRSPLSASEYVVIEQALDTLMIPCMKASGYDYPPNAQYVQAARSVTDPEYAELSIEAAQAFGYHGNSIDPMSALPKRPADEGFILAMFGPPPERSAVDNLPVAGQDIVAVTYGGCYGSAASQVYGDYAHLDQVRQVIQNARINAANSAAADPRTQSAMAAWSACMSIAGYSFANISDASDAGYGVGDSPSADEVRQAVADATCRRDTALFETISKVKWSYEQKFVEDNPGVVQEYASQLQQTLDRAIKLSTGG